MKLRLSNIEPVLELRTECYLHEATMGTPITALEYRKFSVLEEVYVVRDR